MSDIEDRLRAELNRHAQQAPGGTLLAEQIIAAARGRNEPHERRRGWPTWTMPILAAAAVAAIVTGVFVGVAQIREDASPAGPPPVPPLTSHSHRPTVSHSAQPSPTTHPSTTPPHASTSRSTTIGSTNAVGVNNFAASDFSFYGTQDGWAIGTADCLDGSGGSCAAMVRTTDGGRSWKSIPPPTAGGTHIRFATDKIGYAFSAASVAMTKDGGSHWAAQPDGGAEALETYNGNVIRVVADGSGCPGPCNLRIEYAPIGTADWTTTRLSNARVDAVGVVLVRSDAAYVLVTRNTAGGAGGATSTLYASADNGAHWASQGEPCPQTASPEVDSVAVAAAPGGVTALCQVRESGAGRDFTVVSTDGGAHFAPTAGRLPQFSADELAGDPSTVLVAAGQGAYRSVDGGASWAPVPEITGDVSFVGFESTTLGRIVTGGGRTVWTTRDAGASWSAFTFPS